MTTNILNTYVRNYHINRIIGTGGFGTVYHATDKQSNHDVAIKAINVEYAKQAQFIQQFELEACILAQLHHKHIVSFYDFWSDADGAYLVMDWIGSTHLHQYRKQNNLSIPEIIRLINQLASALSYVHNHSIVHRDVKPLNILIDKSNNVFLIDFGIAVDLKIQTAQDVPSFILGSPAYLAPEQIVGNEITIQGDIYSLGIILYELLTNERPFQADSAKKILQMQILNPLPSLRRSRPDLPPEVDFIIWKATAKRPEQRYKSALDMDISTNTFE
jgi:serine/threonine-protein kinase